MALTFASLPPPKARLAAAYVALLLVLRHFYSRKGAYPRRLPKARLAAASVALLLVLRHFYSRKGAHAASFGDPAKYARRLRSREDEYDFDEYDVVIVGGGTAGCVLASRVSEDPSIRVLLIEAGSSQRYFLSSIQNTFATIPASYSRLMRTKYDWALHTVSQANAGSEARYWPRAKMLGGCTCMNAMIFHIGAPEDYAEWVVMQKGQEGASQWAFKAFDRYIRKFEKFTPSSQYPLVDASLRGRSGPVDTGYGYASYGTGKFLEACANVGIPPVPDLNTYKGTLGVSKAMTFITPQGRRCTTEYAYLTAEVLARPNLKVITDAHVTRILFDKSGGTTRAVGVDFTQKDGKFRVKARKEVVMSAGAVHSPQILMLSGVGPAEHLREFNIPVVADLPGVGSHLMDHIVIDLNIKDQSKTSVGYIQGHTFLNGLKLMRELIGYNMTGRGLLTTNLAETIGFIRSTDPKLFPPDQYPAGQVEDTTSGPGAPDIEVFFSPMGYLKHGSAKLRPAHHFALHAVLLRPTSTGTIRLKSRDPQDDPEIDPQYLSTSNDVAVLVRAARMLTRILHTEPLASMVDPTGAEDAALDHTFHTLDDAAVADAVRRKVETLYHPACTARMAPKEDGGVVDPYLRVYGIPNLRVVDASIFPTIVSGHTAATVLAIAEKAAELIRDASHAN